MGSIEAKEGSSSFVWRPDIDTEQPSIENETEEEPQDQEFYFASSTSDSTFEDVKNSLEDNDISTNRLDPADIQEKDGELFINNVEASEFDGKIFYRPGTWFSDLSNDEQLEKMDLMVDLENQHDVDFYGGAQSALIARDKKATKQAYSSKGVGTVQDYSFSETLDKLEEGKEVVAKPRQGTCQGDCVELIESESELESYIDRVLGDFSDTQLEENLLFEEYLPTGKTEENSDMRMIVLGDEIYRKERTDGDGIANNLDNNGKYVEVSEMSYEEEKLAEKSKEIFGEGFYAVDYIKTDDGEVKVLENNATPGTKIDEKLDVDLMEKIAGDAYGSGAPTGQNNMYEDLAIV